MDGLTLAATITELKCIVGSRIEKIQQPQKDELLFSIHGAVGNKRLLISASPDNYRIHLTDEKQASPIDAPMFLMLLRKHLSSSRIVSIEQLHSDRIVVIGFESVNELYDLAAFRLVCEFMGRYSNIVLIDSNDNIIDSIRRVTPTMSSVRVVLPHVKYELPPIQNKLDPMQVTASDFSNALSCCDKPERALSSKFYGLSPQIAGELLNKLQEDSPSTDELGIRLAAFYSNLASGNAVPCIVAEECGKPSHLLPFTPSVGRYQVFPSFCAAIEEFYRSRSENERIKRRIAALEHCVSSSIQRIERKIDKFSLAICDYSEIEKLKLYGELIIANAYMIPVHSSTASVYNYYCDPPEAVEIPLDSTLSVFDNAQQYFKRYRKSKSAYSTAIAQRDCALKELEYLNGVSASLELCVTDSDLSEVYSELAEQGYLKPRQSTVRQKHKLPPAAPYRFLSSNGITILVGKNNLQNDSLTFKTAAPSDLWLHAKDIHGSHVIVKCSDAIPEKTLYEAAVLAAYYSQARLSGNVPVDYTIRRYVKKPSGARPGMVVYTNQSTVYVTPDPLLVEQLKSN